MSCKKKKFSFTDALELLQKIIILEETLYKGDSELWI